MSSFQTAVTPNRRAGTRFISAVRRALQMALVEEAERGLTQAEIARRIGVNRSVVNRELRGVENLTLRRVGELAFAMGRRPVFELQKRKLSSGNNEHDNVSPHIVPTALNQQAFGAANLNAGQQSAQRALNG